MLSRELAIRERILITCLGLQSQARKGCVRLRALAWSFVALRALARSLARRRSYSFGGDADPAAIAVIDVDIPRTAGSDPELASSLGVTRSLLLRHAAEDTELGYCQGMNAVAAVFAVAAGSQDEAYARFKQFTQRLRGLWLPGFPLLKAGMAEFEELTKARPWFQHLSRHYISPDMYLPRAWMPFFAKWLPLSTRILFLGQLENLGLAGLLALSCAILDLHLPGILQQGDMDEALAFLETMQARAPDAAALRRLPWLGCRQRRTQQSAQRLQATSLARVGPWRSIARDRACSTAQARRRFMLRRPSACRCPTDGQTRPLSEPSRQ